MSSLPGTLAGEARVEAVRATLAGTGAWIVGGCIRDALLGRAIRDVDIALRGDPELAARAIARALRGPVFRLSDTFGAWRVVVPAAGFTCDVSPLQGETIEADLERRDFTVNAMALTLDGELVDPLGGRVDLAERRLRVLEARDEGGSAYAADPLRALRLARLAAEIGFQPDERTAKLTRAAAPRVTRAAGERIFGELRRLLAADRVLDGLALADELGLTGAVLPELAALHGVEQSAYHHLDVYDHTIEVLRCQLALERDPAASFGELAVPLDGLMREPLAAELTRWQALRLAALLHDIGKPATRRLLDGGRVSFVGHDTVGEQLIASICDRLRTGVRVRDFVGRITRHHLALGFLVHERPLSRAQVYRYLTTTAPVEVETTVLTCADRLATRGRNADRAIAAHLELARELLAASLDWRSHGPPKPAVSGDTLARELGIARGPELGRLLERLSEARYTGEAATPEAAVALARRLVGSAQ